MDIGEEIPGRSSSPRGVQIIPATNILYIQISRPEVYTFGIYFKIKFVSPPLACFAPLGVTAEEEPEMTTNWRKQPPSRPSRE